MTTHMKFSKSGPMVNIWTWKIILSHFSLNICASPSHVEHAHQKWCATDFIHGRRSLRLAFLETVLRFCFMFFQKCQTWNWWSIFVSSSRICFLIWECLSVVNISILIFSFFNLFKTLTNANFSIVWISCLGTLTYFHNNALITCLI